MGMRAVGLTDHGTFAGAISFLKACRANNIKPVLGMEAYMSRDHRVKNREDQEIEGQTLRGQRDGRKGNRHLNVIAKNFTGYQNICRLSQIASLNGYYYDPRIDFELLERHSKGVIVTSACLSNVINWNLSIDRYNEAKRAAGLFKEIFQDDFYLEVMYHGIDLEGKILPEIQKLGKELNVKIIGTNDTHYIKRSDAKYHEILLCMSSGKCIKNPKRIKFPYEEFYFKSPDEMHKIFGHVPSVLTNTLEIADKCDYSDLKFVDEPGGKMRLPRFDVPSGFDSPHDYLEHLAWEGLRREGKHESPAHKERLARELSDIRLVWDTNRYDFATYFLIVHDIMRFCKSNDIAAGIRGSGYGSLLLKCLGISEGVDPIETGLLWERFLGFSNEFFFLPSDFGLDFDQLDTEKPIKQDQSDTSEETATTKMFDRYS